MGKPFSDDMSPGKGLGRSNIVKLGNTSPNDMSSAPSKTAAAQQQFSSLSLLVSLDEHIINLILEVRTSRMRAKYWGLAPPDNLPTPPGNVTPLLALYDHGKYLLLGVRHPGGRIGSQIP
ncbi:hypothetical protein Tco_1509803 [Tanacetum coccineum]